MVKLDISWGAGMYVERPPDNFIPLPATGLLSRALLTMFTVMVVYDLKIQGHVHLSDSIDLACLRMAIEIPMRLVAVYLSNR